MIRTTLAFSMMPLLASCNLATVGHENIVPSQSVSVTLSRAVGGATNAESMLARKSASGSEYVYVTNLDTHDNVGEIEYFPYGSNGNVAPTGVIAGPNTGLTSYSEGVAVNSAGQIFVAETGSNAILEFASGASGNVAPIASIGGGSTGLAKPVGLAFDSTGNLYVANCSVSSFGCPEASSGSPSIEEFAAGSTGNATPIRRIAGSLTGLIGPFSVAVGAGGDVYVADAASTSTMPRIDVFSYDANGNVRPKRVIMGNNTLLEGTFGIALNEYGVFTDSWDYHYLERFSFHERGNVAPHALIKGKKTELEGNLDGMASAPDGTVFVVDRGGSPSVLQFSAHAHGNAAPLTVLSGPNTGLSTPVFVFVGPGP